jgi:hypothetical protein
MYKTYFYQHFYSGVDTGEWKQNTKLEFQQLELNLYVSVGLL